MLFTWMNMCRLLKYFDDLQIYRVVIMTLSNIYDRAFCKNISRFLSFSH